ncbi:MAG: hypothetical protein HQL74_13150 [Magnetococcales bacterium]|nr:hypothetical protein [Magnetococcales bacterium]
MSSPVFGDTHNDLRLAVSLLSGDCCSDLKWSSGPDGFPYAHAEGQAVFDFQDIHHPGPHTLQILKHFDYLGFERKIPIWGGGVIAIAGTELDFPDYD